MEKKYISIPEVYGIMSKKDDLSDMEKVNFFYVDKFRKMSPEDAEKAVRYIIDTTGIPDKVAVKIVDLKPTTQDELTSILSAYNVMMADKDLNTVIDYLKSLKF
ncbi:MAG: RNA polymerase Rpb4 family protein [Thermoplasmata archaeon]